MLDYSFTLQSVMEVQKAVGALTTKVDRLIDDVDKQSNSVDDIRHKISFVRGAVWVIGIAGALIGTVLTLVFTGKISISVGS